MADNQDGGYPTQTWTEASSLESCQVSFGDTHFCPQLFFSYQIPDLQTPAPTENTECPRLNSSVGTVIPPYWHQNVVTPIQ